MMAFPILLESRGRSLYTIPISWEMDAAWLISSAEVFEASALS
jgi:hypothetical protein